MPLLSLPLPPVKKWSYNKQRSQKVGSILHPSVVCSSRVNEYSNACIYFFVFRHLDPLSPPVLSPSTPHSFHAGFLSFFVGQKQPYNHRAWKNCTRNAQKEKDMIVCKSACVMTTLGLCLPLFACGAHIIHYIHYTRPFPPLCKGNMRCGLHITPFLFWRWWALPLFVCCIG